MDGAGGRDDWPADDGPAIEPEGPARVEHAWDDPIWGTGIPPAGLEERGGTEAKLELIGERLRAQGVADLGRFRRLTDYVNMLQGFFTLRDVILLSRSGAATRLAMPELRVRLDDVAILAQRQTEGPQRDEGAVVLEKVRQHLVLMTPAHLVSGDVHVHAGGSLLHFVDSTDPRFIPMSDVRVRWLDDRTRVGHFEFALVHRAKIVGVATEGLRGGAEEPTGDEPTADEVAEEDRVAGSGR